MRTDYVLFTFLWCRIMAAVEHSISSSIHRVDPERQWTSSPSVVHCPSSQSALHYLANNDPINSRPPQQWPLYFVPNPKPSSISKFKPPDPAPFRITSGEWICCVGRADEEKSGSDSHCVFRRTRSPHSEYLAVRFGDEFAAK